MKFKKAQGHVEMILSLTIFVGFLLFLFIFLNPFAETKEQSYRMEDIQATIMNEITIDVGRLSVIENETNGCYNITEKIKNDYGINYREVKEKNRKYNVYFSDFLTPGAPNENKNCILGKNYSLGTYSKEDFISYKKIQELNRSYELDYKGLKEKLGITEDFSFDVKDLSGNDVTELGANRKIPKGVDVKTIEMPVRIIDENGKILEYLFDIKVW